MTPKRWDLVREVLYGALERASAERSNYLERACAGDSELRVQVESLIRSSEPMAHAVPSNLFEVLRLAGTKIDHFEILSLLGSGGMGEVYRARDLHLGREVAIKLCLLSSPRTGSGFAASNKKPAPQQP